VCIAFLLLFIAGFILVILAGWAAQKLVRLSMLDWVDRLGGGVFSFLKAVVIAWIFVRSVESSPFTYMQNNFRPSITYRLLAALPPKLVVPYFDRSGRSVGRLLGSDAVREVQKEFSNVRLKLDSARTVIDKPAQPKKPAKKQPPPARKRGE
jgi:uncharacterized membrane protein required for colicin V production